MLLASMVSSECLRFGSKKQPLNIELHYLKCMEGNR